MLIVIILNVVMLSVVRLNVIMLSVIAPKIEDIHSVKIWTENLSDSSNINAKILLKGPGKLINVPHFRRFPPVFRGRLG
jgi:hypothetical protein